MKLLYAVFSKLQIGNSLKQITALRKHQLHGNKTVLLSLHCRELSQQSASSVPNLVTGAFRPIDGSVDSKSLAFQQNQASNLALVKKFSDLLQTATSGGDAKSVERHTVKNKKLLVTDRLKLLFDKFEDVLEVMPLAGFGMKYGDVPRAGVLTAVGKIHGVHCMVIANDATVKAGTIYPITLKKQLRSLEIAQENGLPCIFVVDSGGAFLPLQAEIFNPGGRTFYNEAIMNSLDIPEIAIVCGSCTAGAAYVPTMAQEAIIVEKIGTIFLGGPPLVHAALGEVVTPDELGGARLHSTVSGCTDYMAQTEVEAFEIARSAVTAFNIHPVTDRNPYKEPVFDPEEILGIIPSTNDQALDMRKIIARIVDDSRMHEFKLAYGVSIITGFCHIEGFLVGVVGNNGQMTSEAALKGSHFVQLCSQRSIPIVFFQNTTSNSSELLTIQQATTDGEKLRSHAKFLSSVACSHVPKITVVIGKSYGIESYMMGGRSFGPRFLYSWPTASVCIGDPELLANQENVEDGKWQDTLKQIRFQSSGFYSSSQGWDDGMILPSDTRRVLGKSLEIIYQMPHWTYEKTSKSVIRM